jgi:hypothetical protein
MTLSLSKVHEYKKANDGSPAVLIRSSPVLRLGRRTEDELSQVYVFVQNGEFYTENGELLPPEMRPKWLAEELAKVNPKVRAEVGLKVGDPVISKR